MKGGGTGECLSKIFKKTLPILVFTLIEYGELKQIILHLFFRLSLAFGLHGVSGIKAGFS